MPRDRVASDNAADALPKALFEHRPPRHKRESETIIEHSEAAAGEHDRAAISAGNRRPVRHWPSDETGLRSNRATTRIRVPSPQGIQQIAPKDDAGTTALAHSLLDEEVLARTQRLLHDRSESLRCRSRARPADELSVEPRGAHGTNLLLDQ